MKLLLLFLFFPFLFSELHHECQEQHQVSIPDHLTHSKDVSRVVYTMKLLFLFLAFPFLFSLPVFFSFLAVSSLLSCLFSELHQECEEQHQVSIPDHLAHR